MLYDASCLSHCFWLLTHKSLTTGRRGWAKGWKDDALRMMTVGGPGAWWDSTRNRNYPEEDGHDYSVQLLLGNHGARGWILASSSLLWFLGSPADHDNHQLIIKRSSRNHLSRDKSKQIRLDQIISEPIFLPFFPTRVHSHLAIIWWERSNPHHSLCCSLELENILPASHPWRKGMKRLLTVGWWKRQTFQGGHGHGLSLSICFNLAKNLKPFLVIAWFQ